jgi:peptidoglycan/LPS O-acetylase OafA/YrhL
MSESSRRIPSLDGLRAVSIGLVLFEHLAGTAGFPIGLETVRRFIGEPGSLGVRIFFVISGFLITSLLLEEIRTTGSLSLGGFYVRRMFRIFPAAYTFIAVAYLLSRLGLIQVLERDFLHAVTYTMNFHTPKSYWMVHLWSLSVEEQFYMFWPALLLVAGVRGATFVAVAQVLLAPVIRLIIWYRFPAHRDFQQFEAVMDSIASGCLLAVWKPWMLRQPAAVAFLRSRWFFAVPVAILAVMCLSERSFAVYMAHDSFMNVAIAICVGRFVAFPGDLAGRFLNLPAVRYVGTLSYSLYLWQELFVDRKSTAAIESFPLNLLLAFAVGIASFTLVEQPMLRLRARLAARRKRVRPDQEPFIC